MNLVSASKHQQNISPEAFARFLARLGPDPARAGEAYEELRQRLVKFMECRGVVGAEDLTDEVFNRVTRRVAEGEVIENLPAYCLSVARFVVIEHFRSPKHRQVELDAALLVAAPVRENEGEDERLACLRGCLQAVTAENRTLLLEYYQDTKRAKIDVRQAMAERLGITRNALANRMVRLRTQLEQCITRCMKKKAAQIQKN